MQRSFGNLWENISAPQQDPTGQRSSGYGDARPNPEYNQRPVPTSSYPPVQPTQSNKGINDLATNVFDLLTKAIQAVKTPAGDAGKRPATQSASDPVSEAKRPRYDPLEDTDYRKKDVTWQCNRCGNTNFEGRNDCVKCSSAREVPEDIDYRIPSSQGDNTDMGMFQAQMRKKRKLFVRGLLPISATSDLFKYFTKWGPMDHVHVVTDNFGISKGFGFVHYINPEDAERCLVEGPHFIHKKEIDVSMATIKGNITDSKQTKDLLKHVNTEMLKMRKTESEGKPKLKLYVANMSSETTGEQLFCHFVKWGNIADYRICQADSLGYRHGFVTYADDKDAFKCMADEHMLNSKKLAVKVSHASKNLIDAQGIDTGSDPSQEMDPRYTTPHYQNRQLTIAGMSYRTSNDQLLCYFSRWGGIEDYDVELDTTGRKTGKGFVRFGTEREAKNALEFGTHTIDGTKVIVTLHAPPKRIDVIKPQPVAVPVPKRRSPSPQIVIPGLSLTNTNTESDAVSQTKFVCKVSGCFFKGTQNQFDRHWFERHMPKVKYLICAFCSMGCVDEDDLVEHLNFFHGVEDKREMSKFLIEVETEYRDNMQYIMPGNVTRLNCMMPADPGHELSRSRSVSNKPSVNIEIHRCNEYACTFTGTKDEFLVHWNDEHLSDLIYLRCPMCPKTFQKRASLQFHIEHVHQNNGNDEDELPDPDIDDVLAGRTSWSNQRASVETSERRISKVKTLDDVKTVSSYTKQPVSSGAVSRMKSQSSQSKHIPTISGMGTRNTSKSSVQSHSQTAPQSVSASNSQPPVNVKPSMPQTGYPQPVGTSNRAGYIPPQPIGNAAPSMASQFPTPVYVPPVTPIMPPLQQNMPPSQPVPTSTYPSVQPSAMTIAPQQIQQGYNPSLQSANPPHYQGPPHAVGSIGNNHPQPLVNVPQRFSHPQPSAVPNFVHPVQTPVQRVPFPPNPLSALPVPTPVLNAPPRLGVPVRPTHPFMSQPSMTGAHVISAPPQLVNAQRQVMQPPQALPRAHGVQQVHPVSQHSQPQLYPKLQPQMRPTNVVTSTTKNVSVNQPSVSSVPSAYPGLIGSTKSTDVASWYKKVTDSLLTKAKESKSKDAKVPPEEKKDKGKVIDASPELLKSLKKNVVVAGRPDWPQELKESSPLPSMKNIREKRMGSKKGPMFKIPSIVIPAFKRTNCESMRAFLTWNEIMIKRLEYANLKARKRFKAELIDADDDDEDEEETDVVEISTDEEEVKSEIVKEDKVPKTSQDTALEEMKKRAETLAEKLLTDYKSNPVVQKAQAARAAIYAAEQSADIGVKRIKETAQEKQQFGKVVSRAMGMAKDIAKKRLKGDENMQAKAMSWAKNKLIDLKKQTLDEKVELKSQGGDSVVPPTKIGSIGETTKTGSGVQQRNVPLEEEHVAVYVDAHGKENEEYTLAYIDEGGVHVMEEGYVMGKAGPEKRENAQNIGKSAGEGVSSMRVETRGRGRGRGQVRSGRPFQNRGQGIAGRGFVQSQTRGTGQMRGSRQVQNTFGRDRRRDFNQGEGIVDFEQEQRVEEEQVMENAQNIGKSAGEGVSSMRVETRGRGRGRGQVRGGRPFQNRGQGIAGRGFVQSQTRETGQMRGSRQVQNTFGRDRRRDFNQGEGIVDFEQEQRVEEEQVTERNERFRQDSRSMRNDGGRGFDQKNAQAVQRNDNRTWQDNRRNIRGDSGRVLDQEKHEAVQRNDNRTWQDRRIERENERSVFNQGQLENDQSLQRDENRTWQDNRGSFRDNRKAVGVGEEKQNTERNPGRFRNMNRRHFIADDGQQKVDTQMIEGELGRHEGRFRHDNRSNQREDGKRHLMQEREQLMHDRQMRMHDHRGHRDFGGNRGNREDRQSEHEFVQDERMEWDNDEWNREQEGYLEEDERFSEEEFIDFREDDRISRGSGRSSQHDIRRNEGNWRQRGRHVEKSRFNPGEERDFDRHPGRQFDRQDREMEHEVHDQRIVQVVHEEDERFPDEEVVQSERIVQLMEFDDERMHENRVENYDTRDVNFQHSGQQFRKNDGNFRRGGRFSRGERHGFQQGRRDFVDHERKDLRERASHAESLKREHPHRTNEIKSQWVMEDTEESASQRAGQENSWSQSIDKMSSKEQERSKGSRDGLNKGRDPARKEENSRSKTSSTKSKSSDVGNVASWSLSIEKISEKEQERNKSSGREKGPSSKGGSTRQDNTSEKNKRSTGQNSGAEKKWGSGVQRNSGSWSTSHSSTKKQDSRGGTKLDGNSNRDRMKRNSASWGDMVDDQEVDMSDFVVMDVA